MDIYMNIAAVLAVVVVGILILSRWKD